jgi:hypothetical protein
VGHVQTFGFEPSNAWGESTSTQVGAILLEQVGSANQASLPTLREASYSVSGVESVNCRLDSGSTVSGLLADVAVTTQLERIL